MVFRDNQDRGTDSRTHCVGSMLRVEVRVSVFLLLHLHVVSLEVVATHVDQLSPTHVLLGVTFSSV